MYLYRDVARELAANAAMTIPAIRRERIRAGRTSGLSPARKAAALVEQFNFFRAAVGDALLRDATVLEIGPGDAIPLAPLFLAAGARRYVAIDRFLGEVAGAAAQELYAAVLKVAPGDISRSLSALMARTGAASITQLLHMADLVALHPRPVEEPGAALRGRADLIFSFNVCEHLRDMQAAVTGMAEMLAPGGRMVHRVDYGPHDVWLRYENPLAFLTVPELMWKLSSSHRGCPNRVRHGEFVRLLQGAGFRVHDRVGAKATPAQVQAIRPFLDAGLQCLDDEDLTVLDAELVCWRDDSAQP